MSCKATSKFFPNEKHVLTLLSCRNKVTSLYYVASAQRLISVGDDSAIVSWCMKSKRKEVCVFVLVVTRLMNYCSGRHQNGLNRTFVKSVPNLFSGTSKQCMTKRRSACDNIIAANVEKRSVTHAAQSAPRCRCWATNSGSDCVTSAAKASLMQSK